MNELLEARASRVVPATRERVYEAWTRSELLVKWWGRHQGFSVPRAELDVRVGGAYRIELHGPDGNFAFIVGRYLEVVPPERLVWTWSWELPEGTNWPYTSEIGETVVTVELIDRDGSTEVIVTHAGFPSEPARAIHESNWATSLERLADVV